MYSLVTRHFLGSLSEDCRLKRTKVVFECGRETFTASGTNLEHPGFTSIVHWRSIKSEPLPPLSKGERLQVSEVELVAGKTGPPSYLSEAELIGLMEKHGIGEARIFPLGPRENAFDLCL